MKEDNHGFLDFNYYHDTRDFNTLTINALVNLKNRFQYFSLTNYQNGLGARDDTDLSSYFTEQNLRWALAEGSPLDLTAQWMSRNGDRNDVLRFGLRARLTSLDWMKAYAKENGLFYSINLHLIQFDKISGFNWQVEHVYFIKILPSYLDDRVYLSGFLDHNIFPNGSRVVTEQQLGINIVDFFYLVAEHRYNGFITNKKQGYGFGVEYKIVF